MESSVQIVEISTLRYVPETLAWLVGIILAVLMVRRGGGKTEKLLLAGCCLTFIVRLASPLLSSLVQSQVWEQGMSNISRAQTMSLYVALPMGILGLAGLVCLIIAFWVRFRVKRQEAA